MIFEEHDDRFSIKPSTIPGAGDGLFARVFLAEGECLEVIGALIPAESASDSCTRYADCYKFRVGEHLLIPLGYGAMVNHSTYPNLAKVCEGQRVFLKAIRPIQPGEELLFTYGESFFNHHGSALDTFER